MVLSNQFAQSSVKGALDLKMPQFTISAVVDVSESGTLIAGQPVKMVDSAGGVPKVVAIAAITDKVLGFINYGIKESTYVAGDAVEISLAKNVMYMEASAAIARGANVMPVISGVKVATATASNSIIGWAFDKAAGSGELIRVVIETPSVPMPTQAAVVAAEATADGSDAATTQALANALKVKVNAILTSLKAAGLMASS